MRELVGFLLAFLSISAYFALATLFAVYQRYPVVNYFVCGAAIVFLAITAARRRGRRRLVAGAVLALAAVFTALFVWYTLDYSTYASTTAAVQVGDRMGDRLGGLRLPSQDGEAVPLLRLGEDRSTLLVFYRGFW